MQNVKRGLEEEEDGWFLLPIELGLGFFLSKWVFGQINYYELFINYFV